MLQVLVNLLEIDMQSAVMSELRPTAASLAALELERADHAAMLTGASSAATASDETEPFPRCRYRRLHDERVAEAALGVCRLLGERTAATAQLQAILEQFVSLLQDSRCVARSGAAMLAVSTIEGAYSAAARSPACTARVRRAVTMLTESIVECVRDADSALLVAAAQAFEALIRADAASQFASDGDRSDALDAHVMRTLHSLLDLLAHEHAAVQQSARAALQRIARLCAVADVRAAGAPQRRLCDRLRVPPHSTRAGAAAIDGAHFAVGHATLGLACAALAAGRRDRVGDGAPRALRHRRRMHGARAAGRVCRRAVSRGARAAADPLPPRLVRVTAPLAALLPRAIRSRSLRRASLRWRLTSRLVGALKVAHDRAGRRTTRCRGECGRWRRRQAAADCARRVGVARAAARRQRVGRVARRASRAGDAGRRGRLVPAHARRRQRRAGAAHARFAPMAHALTGALHSGQHKRTLLALDCLSVIARRCELPPATLASIGALAHDVAQSYDWRDVPDVAARLKSLQTDASALAAHAAR
jgi:hypothetical protein